MRTLIRPTGFVDSPFGHDGKVARLAGGLSWFGLVELIQVDGHRRAQAEIVPVEGIEARFDGEMAADWARIYMTDSTNYGQAGLKAPGIQPRPGRRGQAGHGRRQADHRQQLGQAERAQVEGAQGSGQ